MPVIETLIPSLKTLKRQKGKKHLFLKQVEKDKSAKVVYRLNSAIKAQIIRIKRALETQFIVVDGTTDGNLLVKRDNIAIRGVVTRVKTLTASDRTAKRHKEAIIREKGDVMTLVNPTYVTDEQLNPELLEILETHSKISIIKSIKREGALLTKDKNIKLYNEYIMSFSEATKEDLDNELTRLRNFISASPSTLSINPLV